MRIFVLMVVYMRDFYFERTYTVILGLKVHLAFGKTLEADLTEVLVRSVANPRALLTLAFRSLSNGFAS